MTISSVGSTPPVQFTGIESGLNTEQIISAYLEVDEAPMEELESQQETVNTKISAYQLLQGQLSSLQSAAQALSAPDAFASAVSASSTDSSVATATTGTGATSGSTTFSVDQLAAANTLVSSGTVASTSDAVASGSLLVASGGSALGISGLAAGSGLTEGSHTIAVTQASAGASVTGSSPLAQSTTISSGPSGNDVLSGTIGTTAFSYTLASGSYTATQLAAEIATASGGTLVGSLTSSGALQVTTAQQGSQASLAIGGGSADATLGLSSGQSGTGTDGVITVDGTKNTVSSIAPDGSTVVDLTSGSGGTVTATLAAGGLSVGSITAQSVSVGNGSLASVVSAINDADAGVSAQALQVGANAYALELSATATGSGNDVSIDPASFSQSPLGTLDTTTAGQDAIVSLGGEGGYQISSSTNTFTSLLPGVSIDVASKSSSPVTVSVAPDGTAAANQVQSFVNAVNSVLSAISGDLAYDPSSNTSGPLNGDVNLENLSQHILATIGAAIGSSSVVDSGSAGSAAGLSLGQDTINFDASTFASDFDANPSAVAKLFTQAGSFTPASGSPASSSDVSLVYAGNTTQPGNYAVQITQSATQATDTGSATFGSGATLGGAASYSVTSGEVSASYGVQAGQTLEQVVGGLDGAFAAAGLQLSAEVVTGSSGSSVEISSANYGSAQSFTVSSTGGDPLGLASGSAFTGTDVAGTIDGVAATGEGQILTTPTTNTTLAGLSLQVSTPGVSSATDLGSYDYSPGVAQSLASLAAATVLPDSGEVATSIAALQDTSKSLGSQITIDQQLVAQQETALTQEYTNLETTLTSLKSESSFLSSTFGSSTAGNLVGELAGSSSSSSSSTSS